MPTQPAAKSTGSQYSLAAAIACFTAAALVLIAAVLTTDFLSNNASESLFALPLLGLQAGLILSAIYLRARPTLMYVTLGAALASQLGIHALIWLDRPHYQNQLFARTVITLCTFTLALPVIAMVAKTRFAGPMQIVRRIGIVIMLVAPSAITAIVWLDVYSEVPMKLMFITVTLALLATVGLPLAHLFFGIKAPESGTTTRLELTATCPRCLTSQTLPNGDSACHVCQLKFTLKVEEPTCPACGYLLFKLTSPICPECGQSLNNAAAPA
jgi:hypothetical protein